MAKTKRLREDASNGDHQGMHPSRSKRVKLSEDGESLAKIYHDLADEVQAVRIKAAGDLVKHLSKTGDDQIQALEKAETRLIKGLCSGRKAARLGFSIALAEVLRLRFSLSGPIHQAGLTSIVAMVVRLTETEGNVSGQERRDNSIGRRFAFQAILQSDVGSNEQLPDNQWSQLLQAVYDLAGEKQWLRRECCAMLHEYLTSAKGAQLKDSRVHAIVDAAAEKKLLKTPEGVGLWITVQVRFPSVALPKGVWHHNDPLSSKERSSISKVLLENATDDDAPKKKAGARQSSPSFAWTVILSKLFKDENEKHFAKFWDGAVASPMFSSSSSTERKALGLQIFSLAISIAPKPQLQHVLHQNIVRGVVDQRAKKDNYLFDAAIVPLSQMVALGKQEPSSADSLVIGLVEKGGFNFDQLTKTKTVETIVSEAGDLSLQVIAKYVQIMVRSEARRERQPVEARLKQQADFLLMMVRGHRNANHNLPIRPTRNITSDCGWLGTVLETFALVAYSETVPASDATKTLFRSRLMSCLNVFLDPPLEHSVKAPVFVIRQVDRPSDAVECLDDALSGDSAAEKAFALLLALSILQVYNEEPDATEALNDLVMCYKSRNEDGGNDSTTMLIELLLSFVSKPSALFRKLAEQVFTAFAAELTADSLQSLTDILEQKESLSGQQELFEQNDGDDDKVEEIDAEDGDSIDMDDLGDLELVNGDDASASPVSDASSAEDSDDPSVEEGADEDNDEEAAFDKKLAEALGTAGMDEDEDESDMDDEQMIALEPHLATIFKERQKQTSKKQDKKDAKENIVNFKNRVLDLLEIYVKSQYTSVLALDLILPLTTLVRTTKNKPTAEKAFAVLKQYFDTCSKHKALPAPDDYEACFTVLSVLHDEMKKEGSKMHASACSRSSLFLAKVLIALDRKHFERIDEMYGKLRQEWYCDQRSKVPGSVFTEWMSWCISTRKA